MLPRSLLVPFALGAALFACGSGGDPSAGSEVGGVIVVPGDTGSNSGNAYIDGVALGTGGTFVSTGQGQSCGNNSCGSGTSGFALSFVPSAAQAVSFANSGSPEDVALSPSGSFFWGAPQTVLPVPTCTSGVPGVALWSASTTASASQVPVWATFPLVTPTSTGQNCGSGTNDEIVGIVADADAVYVAVAEIPSSNGGNVVSPDSPCWIQTGPDNCGSNEVAHVTAPGFIYAVAAGSTVNLQAAPPAVPTTFDPATAIHTLVDAGSSVCWLDASAHVTCAPKGWASGPVPTPRIQVVPVPPKGWSFVATASSGTTYAWAASPDVAIGASGCLVWASVNGGAPAAVYDGSQADFFCRGLAIDGQYAYVTMNQLATSPCSGCSSNTYVAGNGVARIPLAGGVPVTVPLQSDEWYGPRRVFVDDTYVYAVDPSYVLRVEKTAFGP